VKYNRLLQAAN